jgi:hypothetical protein
MAERFSEFDIDEAGEAFGAEPHATRDVAHGDGQAIDLGDTTLEVYRNARVARVTTPDARYELFRVPSYEISDERLVFQQADEARTRLLLGSDGRVWLFPGLPAPESSRTEEMASPSEVVSPARTAPSADVTQRPDGNPGPAPEQQEQQQQLSGRLGRDPWFGTRGEEPAAGFPLAVNDEQGKTTWHRVFVLGELVEQVRTGLQKGQIKKGRPVQLSGIEVVQSEPTAKGGTKTTKEFHATNVIPIKSPAK